MNNTTRQRNLSLLAYENDSQASLAGRLGMEHKEIVRFFKNKHLDISDDFARKIERVLKKPPGWMDRKNFDIGLTGDEWKLLTAYRHTDQRGRKLLLDVANVI
jgi:transcriptional regulator with XRE-family HTH domain